MGSFCSLSFFLFFCSFVLLSQTNSVREASSSPQETNLLLKIQKERGDVVMPYNDPLFPAQWHLWNREVGEADINVLPVWGRGYFGNTSTIAVCGFPFQKEHPDLSQNFNSDLSIDYTEGKSPDDLDYAHGTACAGLISGVLDNSVCGAGVAPQANLVSIRFRDATDPGDAGSLALRHEIDNIQVYSNSWGAPADDGNLHFPSGQIADSFRHGTLKGRGGLGSVYVFSAGNGGETNDNCNYDGYANSLYTIAVGGITRFGTRSSLSEKCCAMLVTAPSGSAEPGGSFISTTDLVGNSGYSDGDCTQTFRGTDASAPLVAGVVALMLEVNPALSWRDVQHILAFSARPIDLRFGDWFENGAGRQVSHKYGFGLVDANAAVSMASNFRNLPLQLVVESKLRFVNRELPDAGTPIVTEVNIIENIKVEHVEILVEASHEFSGDLHFELTSPSGTKNILAEVRGVKKDGGRNLYISVQRPGRQPMKFPVQESLFGEKFLYEPQIFDSVSTTTPPDCCNRDWCSLVSENDNELVIIQESTSCNYTTQILLAQESGAKAVLISTTRDALISMDGQNSKISIPSAMILRDNAQRLLNYFSSDSKIVVTSEEIIKEKKSQYVEWLFRSVLCWGEPAKGVWQLSVRDVLERDLGTFEKWKLKIYGTQISPDIDMDALDPFAPQPPDPVLLNEQLYFSDLQQNPLYPFQWHLENAYFPGQDLQVIRAWELGLTGKGVRVSLVGHKFKSEHPDLVSSSSNQPMIQVGEKPGANLKVNQYTSMAGLIAADPSNGVCGVGVAPGVDLYNVQFLDQLVTPIPIPTQNYSAALDFSQQGSVDADIVVASWTFRDDSRRLFELSEDVANIFRTGTTNGRNGKGSVFIFGAGDGAEGYDQCGYDGYANSHFTLTVGALNVAGKAAHYSERCSAVLVSSPGGDWLQGMGTLTDYSSDDDPAKACDPNFEGTEAAAPLVAGVVALMLEANPNLTWREIQHILLSTATKNDPLHQDWTQNGAELWVNHHYGFGMVNAAKAVEMAADPDYEGLPPQGNPFHTGDLLVGLETPGDLIIIENTVSIQMNMVVEYVKVRLTMDHPNSGDLVITLRSPAGTESRLADVRGIESKRVYLTIGGEIFEVTPTKLGPRFPFKGEYFHSQISTVIDCCSAESCRVAEGVAEPNLIFLELSTECPLVTQIGNIGANGFGGYLMGIMLYPSEEGPEIVKKLHQQYDSIGLDYHHDLLIPCGILQKEDALAILDLKDSHWSVELFVEVVKQDLIDPFDAWTFLTVRHYGERSRGAWTLEVQDVLSGGRGLWVSWGLEIIGHSIQNEMKSFIASATRAVPSLRYDDLVTPYMSDPLAPYQYHLQDFLSLEYLSGHTALAHIDVVGAWKDEILGNGIVVSLVGDSVVSSHPDLRANYKSDLSYHRFPDGTDASVYKVSDRHYSRGTGLAGLIAASANNSYCGAGVAPAVGIANYQFSEDFTGSKAAAAGLGFMNDKIDIYVASWDFDGCRETSLIELDPDILQTLERGVEEGRGGKGSIFVVGAGNEKTLRCNVNCDGFVSSRYTIAVGSTTAWQKLADYSTLGAAVLVVAPGGSLEYPLTSIDATESDDDSGKCTYRLYGTEASAAIVGGVVALMLEANQNLTWRDVQYILIETAKVVDEANGQWQVNGGGLYVSPIYGFGKVAASKAVRATKFIRPRKEATKISTNTIRVNSEIPDPSFPGESGDPFRTVVEISSSVIVEHVEVTVDVLHPFSGDLSFDLISPYGTISPLMNVRGSAELMTVMGVLNDEVYFVAPNYFGPSIPLLENITFNRVVTSETDCCGKCTFDILNGLPALAILPASSRCTPHFQVHFAQRSAKQIQMVLIVSQDESAISAYGESMDIKIPSGIVSASDGAEILAASTEETFSISFQSAWKKNPENVAASYNPSWKFTSVMHWGEQARGRWELKIVDHFQGDQGIFNSWKLDLHGVFDDSPSSPPPPSPISDDDYYFSDPLMPQAWHLQNFGQLGGKAGSDINVAPTWDEGVAGSGVTIALTGFTVERNHPDFNVTRYSEAGSADLSPGMKERQRGVWTELAGLLFSQPNNEYCAAGVAHLADYSFINFLDALYTDELVSKALSHQPQINDIYVCPWGPVDDPSHRGTFGPGPLTLDALEEGVLFGRDGKGSIFVFHSGNGLQQQDNCNLDGYSSNPFTISVGSVNQHGTRTNYGEPCVAMLVCAPGGDQSAGIVSTFYNEKTKENQCKTDFIGSESSAALTAGVIALMLEANQNLTWRCVQHILVETARQVDPIQGEWEVNAAEFPYSRWYGFGLVNSYAAVDVARHWPGVLSYQIINTGPVRASLLIPDTDSSTPKSHVYIEDDIILEVVEVVLYATHPYSGALTVTLTSPSGTNTELTSVHSVLNKRHSVQIFKPSLLLEQFLLPTKFSLPFPIRNFDITTVGVTSPPDCCDFSSCVLISSTLAPYLVVLQLSENCTPIEQTRIAQNNLEARMVLFYSNENNGKAPVVDGNCTDCTIFSGAISFEFGDNIRKFALVAEEVGVHYRARVVGMKENQPPFDGWSMSSLQFWGESSKGLWRLSIENSAMMGTGTLNGWQMILRGGSEEPIDQDEQLTYVSLFFSDPSYRFQWHLQHEARRHAGTIEEVADINVFDAWRTGIFGESVVVAVTGFQFRKDHPDLVNQYSSEGSYDFNPGVPSMASQATLAAGAIAAEADNDFCGVGVAPKATLTSLAFLGTEDPAQSTTIAAVLTHSNQFNDVYANGWGPEDDGVSLFKLSSIITEALEQGINEGRYGKGSIHVFPSGNGREVGDSCNYDGFSSHYGTVTVAGLNIDRRRARYSEGCSALLLSAPGGDSNSGIVTTDLGFGSASDCGSYSGTEAASPLVAGVIALMLDASDNILTWREVQHILVMTSKVIDEDHGRWITNGGGRRFSHFYGYGIVDAGAAVDLAARWKEKQYYLAPFTEVRVSNDEKVSALAESNVIISQIEIESPIIVEHVVAEITINHPSPNDIELVLESPEGTQSILAEVRGVTKRLASLTVYNPTVQTFTIKEHVMGGEPFSFDPLELPLVFLENCCEPQTCILSSVPETKTFGVVLNETYYCSFSTQVFYAQKLGASAVLIASKFKPPISERNFDGRVRIPSGYISPEGLVALMKQEDPSSKVTISVEAVKKTNVSEIDAYPFMSLAHWGENARGNWSLRLRDVLPQDGVDGEIVKWSLRLLGGNITNLNDPLYPYQWILENNGPIENGTKGTDLHALSVFNTGITGKGVTVCFVGKSFDQTHPEIAPKFFEAASANYSGMVDTPKDMDHGTSTISVAAAAAGNKNCGVGVAYGASVSQVPLLQHKYATSDLIAKAESFRTYYNHIYLNGFGPPDDGRLFPLANPVRDALAHGVEDGRSGLGSIFIWGNGKGGDSFDNCNYDGFTNNRFSISVASVNSWGIKAHYNEPCSVTLVAAPGGDDIRGVAAASTFDPGCTDRFSGTDASAAGVAGVIALMLQSNPELGWRDVQHILVTTSRVTDELSGGWIRNGAGLMVSEDYGFGLVDAEAAVVMANSFEGLGEVTQIESSVVSVFAAIPGNNNIPLVSAVAIKENVRIEYVTILFDAEHPSSGQLRVVLRSPRGTESVLADVHGFSSRTISFSVHGSVDSVETEAEEFSILIDNGKSRRHMNRRLPLQEEVNFNGVYFTSPATCCTPDCTIINRPVLRKDYIVVLSGDESCDYATQAYYAQIDGAPLVVIAAGGDSEDKTEDLSYMTELLTIPVVTIKDSYSDISGIGAGDYSEVNFKMWYNMSRGMIQSYKTWEFGSAKMWGEESRGVWELEVIDQISGIDGGMNYWKLTIQGVELEPTVDPEKDPVCYDCPFEDPLYPAQWHLKEIFYNINAAGNSHMNVLRLHQENKFGEGIMIELLGDPIQKNHPELRENFNETISVAPDDDDVPIEEAQVSLVHETPIAGLISGEGNNRICGAGVAPMSTFGVLNIFTTTNELNETLLSSRLTHMLHEIDIYVNTWEDSDVGKTHWKAAPSVEKSLLTGVKEGRDKLGAIYVIPSGNGGNNYDNCNYNSFASSAYGITVGSVTFYGHIARYSEPCASLVVVAPGGDTQHGLVTCDAMGDEGFGKGACTDDFTGTDGSSALVGGVVALMLEENPALGWIDVQDILIRTAQKVDQDFGGWERNGAGLLVSHHYGFGLVDAFSAVEMASKYSPFNSDDLQIISDFVSVEESVFLDGTPLRSTIHLSQTSFSVTAVQVTVNVQTLFTGLLHISLISPSKTRSVLAETHSIKERSIELRSSSGKTIPVNTIRVGDHFPFGIFEIKDLVFLKSDDCCYQCEIDPSPPKSPSHPFESVVVLYEGRCSWAEQLLNAQNAGATSALISVSSQYLGVDDSRIRIPVGSVEGHLIQEFGDQTSDEKGQTYSIHSTGEPELLSHYSDWTFTSRRHWGESAEGDWVLEFRYPFVAPRVTPALFQNWNITVMGKEIVDTDHSPQPVPSPTPLPVNPPSDEGITPVSYFFLALLGVVVIIAFVTLISLVKRFVFVSSDDYQRTVLHDDDDF